MAKVGGELKHIDPGLPVVDQNNVRGGYREVATLIDLDNMDLDFVKVGTKVYVISENKEYRVTAIDPFSYVELVDKEGVSSETIGDLDNLTTTNKTSLVEAINELNNNLGDIESAIDSILGV